MPSFKAIITSVIGLPPELVEMIISYLPVSAFLMLITNDDQRMRPYLLSSLHWCLEDTFEDLSTITETLCVFHKLVSNDPLVPWNHPGKLTKCFGRAISAMLSNSPRWFVKIQFRHENKGIKLSRVLPSFLMRAFRDRFGITNSRKDQVAQSLLCRRLYDNGIDKIKHRLSTLLEQQKRCNILLKDALEQLAELLARFPDKLSLSSHEMNSAITNPAHSYNHFRCKATKVSKSTYLGPNFARYLFHCSQLPIVPLNKHLDLFREIMRRHPPVGMHKELNVLVQAQRYFSKQAPEDLELLRCFGNQHRPWDLYDQFIQYKDMCDGGDGYVDYQNFAWYNNKPINYRGYHKPSCRCYCERYQMVESPMPFNYPPHILELIIKVNRNLFITHASDKHNTRARISASCCQDLSGVPKEVINYRWKFYRYARAVTVPQHELIIPTGQEIGWLRSFLELVTYMEMTFPSTVDELKEKALNDIVDARNSAEQQDVAANMRKLIKGPVEQRPTASETSDGTYTSTDRFSGKVNRHGNIRRLETRKYKYTDPRLEAYMTSLQS
jgi:hypothetical protein